MTVKDKDGREKKFLEKETAAFVSGDFCKIFSYKWIAGSPAVSGSKKYSIVLSRSMAKKYFGKENPVGSREESIDFVKYLMQISCK